LKNIKREDPSLRVRIDDQTGQTILLGMGELHIDIIRDRLKREYGLETYLGPLNVNYRETPRKSNQQTIVWNSTINERHATISITLSIEPIVKEDKKIVSFSQIQIVRTDEQNFEHLRKEHVGRKYTVDHFFS
jgi:translation elongation factor EF-G